MAKDITSSEIGITVYPFQVYMFIYGSLGIIQGMFFTYLSATLSTLEKQFGIKSKESAYLVGQSGFYNYYHYVCKGLILRG